MSAPAIAWAEPAFLATRDEMQHSPQLAELDWKGLQTMCQPLVDAGFVVACQAEEPANISRQGRLTRQFIAEVRVDAADAQPSWRMRVMVTAYQSGNKLWCAFEPLVWGTVDLFHEYCWLELELALPATARSCWADIASVLAVTPVPDVASALFEHITP